MHECHGKSANHKFKDLDALINAINTGINAPVIVHVLKTQIEPPLTERVMGVRVSS